MRKLQFLAIIIALLGGCAAKQNKTNQDLTSLNEIYHLERDYAVVDDEATTAIQEFLKANSIDVTRHDDYILLVNYGARKFTMTPRLLKGQLSRLVVRRHYSIREDFHRSTEIVNFVFNLNQRTNFGQFSVTGDGESLMIRSSITFVDNLDIKEVRKFLTFFNDLIYATIEAIPETHKYLY